VFWATGGIKEEKNSRLTQIKNQLGAVQDDTLSKEEND